MTNRRGDSVRKGKARMIFRGTRETLRTLLLFLAAIQGTAGVGLISIVTALLSDSDTAVSLSEPYVFVPLILHGIAMACEIGLVLRLNSWKENPEEQIGDWRIDGTLLAALSAFGGLVWFLVRTLW